MALFKKIIARVFVWLVIAAIYAPLLIIVVFSFSEGRTIRLDSFEFTFELYSKLFVSEEIREAVLNSFLIAGISSLIATIMGTITCIGVLSMKPRAKGIYMSVNQLPIINADIVTSFALMVFFVSLGIFKNMGYGKLIIAHTVICLPYVVLSVMPRLKQLNPNLFEAAQDLGANSFQALTKVLLPQLLPGILSGFLLGFTLSLDDFVITIFNSEGVKTISTIVYSATKKGVPAEYRALSTIIFLIVMIVLIVINIKPKKQKNRKRSEN